MRCPDAIPQLTVDHPERMERLERLAAKHPGLVFAGNYLTGVGVDHAVGSGYRAAESAQEMLNSSSGGRKSDGD